MSLTAESGNETFDKITAHMLEAYARGAEIAKIYTGDEFAFNAITKWSRGWIRKAGPNGIWKNSKGNELTILKRNHMNFRTTDRSSSQDPNCASTSKKNTAPITSGQKRDRTESTLW